MTQRRLTYDAAEVADRYTHYLFRYPAKFHPPVVRALVENYTQVGDVVLDCFVGSGTLLVEGALAGRNTVGVDVDPVAVFASRVKSRPLAVEKLRASWSDLAQVVKGFSRGSAQYDKLQWKDIGPRTYAREIQDEWVPEIPNLLHWFRRYVVVDLARMRAAIEALDMTESHRDFFMLCFASIIRGSSNADPVPVSGLEVTSHMKARDAKGRIVDPFRLLDRAVERNVKAMDEYCRALPTPRPTVTVIEGDAIDLKKKLRNRPISAVITSPPYHGAVDYYRRHQLEMFWLGFTESQRDRLDLLDRYIGRVKVPNRDPLITDPGADAPSPLALERRMRKVSFARANGLRHYQLAMHHVFGQLASVLPSGAPAVFVVGHSRWGRSHLNTTDLFRELAEPHFQLEEVLNYDIQNRYMSYARHNGANINREFVLVLRRLNST